MNGGFDFGSHIKVDVLKNGDIMIHRDIRGEHKTVVLRSEEAATRKALMMLGWTPPDVKASIVAELLEAAREALSDWKELCDAAYNRDGHEYERLAKALEEFK